MSRSFTFRLESLRIMLSIMMRLRFTILFRLGPAGVTLMLGASAALASADADRAREGVAAGRYLALEQIIEDATSRYPGRVVEVELDDDEYEIEILLDDGAKVELEYDAGTGELLEVDIDD